MKAIYLIGFMGSGKTTVGLALAKHLHVPMYDTDQAIEQKCGMSVSDLFNSKGEEAFRDMEATILEELPTQDVVISTGGGIVLKERNRRFLQQKGIVILLDASPEEIAHRLEHDRSRPLLASNLNESINTLFKQRDSFYRSTAQLTLLTDGKNVEAIIAELMDAQGQLVKLRQE